MAIAKIRGTIIQAASSRESPWIGTPTALASLRWYLKKKKTMATVMATAKKKHTALIKASGRPHAARSWTPAPDTMAIATARLSALLVQQNRGVADASSRPLQFHGAGKSRFRR